MRPKYSIILPTLNGARTLSLTLPAMLRIQRDDVEWVVSENHSDDDTWPMLQEIAADDERVKLIQPAERLPLGKHLEFAYRHATGKWLSHLGDDDHLLPWRFDLLDQVLDQAGEKCGLVRGEYVRYSWPNFPEASVANSVDPAAFASRCELVSGTKFAAELLNRVHIHGGGSWVVRNDIASGVRKQCGWFASPQHVEFFAMRAAACLSDEVALLHLPLFVLGRHGKSSGSQYFLPRESNQEKTWDWSFEDPEQYGHAPFNWKSYSTLSLDGALAVQRAFAAELGGVRIDWKTWLKAIHSEMMRLIAYRQLPIAARNDFLRAVALLPSRGVWYWRWRTWRLQWQQWWQRPMLEDAEPTTMPEHELAWAQRIHGDQAGFDSIVSLTDWLSHSQPALLLGPTIEKARLR